MCDQRRSAAGNAASSSKEFTFAARYRDPIQSSDALIRCIDPVRAVWKHEECQICLAVFCVQMHAAPFLGTAEFPLLKI